MTKNIECDYLVVGAGAAGMAFTDELLTHSDATIALVDRRHAPGGHWVDAYPYVRLHQPSAMYGVSSMPLGRDAIDTHGPNAGFYELAGADEIRDYYSRVMTQRFLASGRVRYLSSCNYVGDHKVVSRLGPASWNIRPRRKVVDATYMEGSIPATSPPPFEIEEGVQWVTAGGLTGVADRPERYVIIGAGKTALDAIVWLLEHGVEAAAIQWIKPREGWWMNRAFQQPFTLSPDYMIGVAKQLEAMADSTSVDEVMERLEADGIFLRVDPNVLPTMLRGAIISELELDLLRQVEDVVRMGHVQRITTTEITLDDGRSPTSEQTLHVHCASPGLGMPPTRPIFDPSEVHIQPIGWGYACYQYATLGVVEAVVDSDAEKNRLCAPIRYWNDNVDLLRAFLANMVGERARMGHPTLASWIKSTRLNPRSTASDYNEHPKTVEAKAKFRRFGLAAATNLPAIIAREHAG